MAGTSLSSPPPSSATSSALPQHFSRPPLLLLILTTVFKILLFALHFLIFSFLSFWIRVSFVSSLFCIFFVVLVF
jgi:hypothetical protein